MKIDSHQHFWKFDANRYSWIDDSMEEIRKDFLPKDLEPLLEKNDFGGCVAVQADQSSMETEFLLELAAENSFIKGVVGWADLTAENIEQDLEKYALDLTFKGVRHTVYDAQGEFMRRADFQNGINKLSKFGFTYDILAFHYQLPGALDLVRQFPEQEFVLDHLGKPQISGAPFKDWITNIRELAKNENLHCKLSGMFTETDNLNWEPTSFFPFLDVVLEAFGTDRLMFGSDWPMCLLGGNYTSTEKLLKRYLKGYSQEDIEKIFGQNAVGFYKLS